MGIMLIIINLYSGSKDKETKVTADASDVPVVEHAFLTNVDNNILSNCDKTKISLQRYYIPPSENSNQLYTFAPMSHSNLYKFPHKQRNNNYILDYMYNDTYADGTPMYKVLNNNLEIVPRCNSKYMGHML